MMKPGKIKNVLQSQRHPFRESIATEGDMHEIPNSMIPTDSPTPKFSYVIINQ